MDARNEASSVSVEQVVHDKKIILQKSLLQECGYDDMDVVDFMTKGVPQWRPIIPVAML